jgi:hypothetical protein
LGKINEKKTCKKRKQSGKKTLGGSYSVLKKKQKN